MNLVREGDLRLGGERGKQVAGRRCADAMTGERERHVEGCELSRYDTSTLMS